MTLNDRSAPNAGLEDRGRSTTSVAVSQQKPFHPAPLEQEELALEAEAGWTNLLKLSLPSMATQFARVCSVIVVYHFAGKYLSAAEFGGISLGLSFGNMTLLTFGVGIQMVLDTLCTQEYGSDRRSPRQGLFLFKATFLFLLWAVPMSVLYLFFAEPIITAWLGVGDGDSKTSLAHWAAVFLQVSPLSNIPLALFFGCQKFLAAQGKVLYPLLAQLLVVIASVPLVYIGVGHGVTGVGIALGISRLIGLLTVVICSLLDAEVRVTLGLGKWKVVDVVRFYGLSPSSQSTATSEAAGGGTSSRGAGADPFLRLLPHSLFVACSERWAYEVLSVLAGLRGTISMDAFVIAININSNSFSLAVGTYVAGATTVGNLLGKRQPQLARKAALRALGLISGLSLMVLLLVYTFSTEIVSFYSSDPVVLARAQKLLKISPLMFVGDNLAYTYQGIFRASGQMGFLSMAVTISQWFVSVLGAVLLSLPSLGGFDVEGIIVALIAGLLVQFLLSLKKHAGLDWEGVSKEVADRREAELHRTSEESPDPVGTAEAQAQELEMSSGVSQERRSSVAAPTSGGGVASGLEGEGVLGVADGDDEISENQPLTR